MDKHLTDTLIKIVGAEHVVAGEPMNRHTTFKVGGPAELFVTPASVEQVQAVLAACVAHEKQIWILGRGSNLVVADRGIRGVVIHIGPEMSNVSIDEDGTIIAEAGSTNAKVARLAQSAGLSGYEFAAGIPGSVGGAAAMNAGAHGHEFCDVAERVICLDKTGTLVELEAKDVGWSYRHSMMKDAGYTVVSATLRLKPDEPEKIKERMGEFARYRRETQPLDMPSAGSSFKRPEDDFAGRLIQASGLSGYRVGGAQVSTKHAGFIVNTGDATASDVIAVLRDVRRAVYESSGVLLEPEICLWGFEEDVLG